MISIVIPALNEEKYLPKLMECIKAQTYRDYEVIVADADSIDRTRNIAKAYKCKIAKGGMPAVGRNNGARMAKGEIILFLDADVQFNKNFLKDALDEFERKKLGIAGFRLLPLGSNIVDKLFFYMFNLWTRTTQFFYPNAAGAGILCKKSIHKSVNGFDESIKLSEDMDYARRCGKKGKFRILKSPEFYVAMRRFENEGRLKTGSKLFLSALYRLFFGEIKSDIFRYNLKYRK